MMRYKTIKKAIKYFGMLCLVFSVGFGWCGQRVSAAQGSVYTCNITRTYQHPVTGKIEDSAGGASKATGQGMVEGAVFSKGLLEVTSQNEYYLTFRMSLIDYTSDHSFSVQKRGESSWMKCSVVQTGTGKDNNGKTADLRIRLRDKDSIIRCSMYVQPMGRNVIFYFYPENFMQGNTSGMKAKIITTTKSQATTASKTTTTAQEATTTSQSQTASTQTATSATISQSQQTQESVLNQAEGLSLSTQPKTNKKKEKTSNSIAMQILVLTVSMTISGLILLSVAAVFIWYFRKNWERWSGDKDEYDEIYEEES